MASRFSWMTGLGVVGLAVGAACSASQGTGASTNNGGSGQGAGSSSGHGANGHGGEDIGFDAGSSDGGPLDDAGACAAEPHVAEQVPLDIYIMLDQSGSMDEATTQGPTKWEAVSSALKTFVDQPSLAGVSVGIQYFGLPAGGAQCSSAPCLTDADCGGPTCGPCFSPLPGIFPGVCIGASASDSCNPVDYSVADVEIAPLPGVAPAIKASINAHSPNTNTPTSAALEGAIMHAKSWSIANPGHAVVVVFATDGDPTECNTDQNYINGVAAAGFNGNPKILTFVIGVGSSLGALNGVAQAGGSGSAFIVDTNQNVNQAFLDAMNQIRGAALGCNYNIPVPAMGQPDYTKVNVQYTPSNGPAEVFPHYPDKASCPANGDGWYYNNNASPTQIILCDATCAKVSADQMGKIDILLGCKTKDPA